jgi:hypothetical protein
MPDGRAGLELFYEPRGGMLLELLTKEETRGQEKADDGRGRDSDGFITVTDLESTSL